MLSMDNVTSPNARVIKTTEGELTFYVIKEYMYDSSMHLMI